jgi:hypothetical protein
MIAISLANSELPRAPDADGLRQVHGHPAAREDPDARVRVAEESPLGREDEIGAERELETPGDRGPVDGRDHGLAHRAQGAGERVAGLDPGAVPVRPGQVAKVHPGTERRIRAGEHGHAGVSVGVERAQGGHDRRVQLAVDRVAPPRPVQGDLVAALPPPYQQDVRHHCSSSPGPSR